MRPPALLALVVLAGASSASAAVHAYDVDRPAGARLLVVVEPDDGGGTTHFANRVILRGPSGATTVIATPADALEKGDGLVPLFDREIAFPREPSIAVLLGWSSTGSGMETAHAWIVRAPKRGAPVVVEKLAWTTDRVAAGFVVDASRDIRIGVPWTFDGAMHDPEEWVLQIGTRSLPLDRVKELAFVASAAFDAYRPPLVRPPWPAGTRVAWLTATPSGFR